MPISSLNQLSSTVYIVNALVHEHKVCFINVNLCYIIKGRDKLLPMNILLYVCNFTVQTTNKQKTCAVHHKILNPQVLRDLKTLLLCAPQYKLPILNVHSDQECTQNTLLNAVFQVGKTFLEVLAKWSLVESTRGMRHPSVLAW